MGCLVKALKSNNHPLVLLPRTRVPCSKARLLLLVLFQGHSFHLPRWTLYPRSHRALEVAVIVTTKTEQRTETGAIVGPDTAIRTEKRSGTELGIQTETETETTTAVTTADALHPPPNPPRNVHARPARVTRARSPCATATPLNSKCQKLEPTLFRLR